MRREATEERSGGGGGAGSQRRKTKTPHGDVGNHWSGWYFLGCQTFDAKEQEEGMIAEGDALLSEHRKQRPNLRPKRPQRLRPRSRFANISQ